MSSTSTNGYGAFQRLPIEMLLYIMELCNSPEDVFTLIRAHPLSLNVFIGSRRQITRPWTSAWQSRFERLLCPSFLLAARLRHARKQSTFSWEDTTVAEEMLVDAAAPYINSGTSRQYQLRRPLPLSALSSLLSVGEDAEWLVANYAPYAKKRLFAPLTDIFSDEGAQGVLSDNEWERFFKASFHFESYCQMFFHGEELLFERDQNIRSAMFRKRMCRSGHQSTGVEMFYSILFYVYHQHWSIFRKVINYLCALRQTWGAHMANSYIAANDVKMYMYLCYFQSYGPNGRGKEKYLHYLASQGLGMLRNLRRMNMEEQTKFTLSTFFKVSISTHPAVCVTAGPWQFHLGTCEHNSWLPWQKLDDLFTDNLDYAQWTGSWTSGEWFWDQNADDDEEDDVEGDESDDEGWYR